MRNLFLFIARNYYIILFLFLQSFSLFLVFQNRHFQRAHFLNSSNAIAGNIYEFYSEITEYFSLKEQNEKLSKENEMLRNKLHSFYLEKPEAPVTITEIAAQKQYIFYSAKVINNSTHRRNNYLTLNIGAKNGVKEGMGVIASDGVVGIVLNVSEHFASVMSCLHENARIPVVIKKFNEPSIMIWDGKDEDYALLERIPSHLELSKGDTVVTFRSSCFPDGIMAGTVDSFEKVAGNTFFHVILKLSTDFSRLRYVTVVNNLLQEEQIKLEQSTQHDE